MNAERFAPNGQRSPAIHRTMSSKPETRAALAKASREEAARLLKQSILPRGADETIKACIARAAKRLGWPISRTQDIWRQDAARIDAFEMDQLRRLVAGKAASNADQGSECSESSA